MRTISKKRISYELRSFGKAQISAFLGGLVDLSIMVIAVEFFDYSYLSGIVIGGIVGAYVNFTINNKWTFRKNIATNEKSQLSKFIIIVLGSIILKSLGTYLLVEGLEMDYKLGRIITDALVCFGFNYTMQRFWVFGQ